MCDGGGEEVTVLSVKKAYSYTIPSFCAITLKLRHVLISVEENSGPANYDAFFNEEGGPDFSKVLPKPALVNTGCLIEFENEFQYGLHEDFDKSKLQLIGNTIFVAHHWIWLDNEQESITNASVTHDVIPESSDEEEAQDDTDETDSVRCEKSLTHSVTFKCMGANKDNSYQTALEKAAMLIAEGKDVPVRLTPEPTNPKDANAICFECCLEDKWKQIGYVVSDLLPEVHDAIEKNLILSVEFSWVKFLLCWFNSGPGFYAGINITKQGDWSAKAMRYSSTK